VYLEGSLIMRGSAPDLTIPSRFWYRTGGGGLNW
jgi:hypothetical protein